LRQSPSEALAGENIGPFRSPESASHADRPWADLLSPRFSAHRAFSLPSCRSGRVTHRLPFRSDRR